MPRSWFRHQATMSLDHAISTLGREFGPVGEVVWSRLLELHCASDAGITILREDFRRALRLPEGDDRWQIDLDRWLLRAAQLGLITVSSRRVGRATSVRGLCTVRARSWPTYNPDYETKEAATERKRRSRAQSVTVTSDECHSDNVTRSQSTDVRYGRTDLSRRSRSGLSENVSSELQTDARARTSANPLTSNGKPPPDHITDDDLRRATNYRRAQLGITPATGEQP